MVSHKNNADIRAWKKIITESYAITERGLSDVEVIAAEMDDDRLEYNYDSFVNQGDTNGINDTDRLEDIKAALTAEMAKRGLSDDEDMWEAAQLDELSPEGLDEGYKILPPIDQSRYPEINGIEGPFRTLSGHVVYYDPKEGKYYDKDQDIYISYDDFAKMDRDYSNMKDENDLVDK
jgi:hypothetical protein